MSLPKNLVKMADDDCNFDSNFDSNCKASCDNDIDNLHQLLVSAFEANFLSTNFQKEKSRVKTCEVDKNDGSVQPELINNLKVEKKTDDEMKKKKKKCKHKCDKDKPRKSISNKSAESYDSFSKLKSGRNSNFNHNLECNQERSSRRNHHDERYYKGHLKRYNNYEHDDRYNQESLNLNKRRERSRSRSGRDKNLKFDKQKILEIARDNLAKMIEQNKLPQGIDVNRLKLKHLDALNDKKSVQDWIQFCKSVCEKDYQTDSSSDEFDSDLDSESDENKSSSSQDIKIELHGKTKNHLNVGTLKEFKKESSLNENVQNELENRRDLNQNSSSYLSSNSSSSDLRHSYQLNEGNSSHYKATDYVLPPFSRTALDVHKELLQQFPVSSGNDHRIHETNWSQVEQRQTMSLSAKARVIHSLNKNANLSYQEEYDKRFCEEYQNSININSINSQRINTMRKFQEDAYNIAAYRQCYDSPQLMSGWPTIQALPGQFMGAINAPASNPNKLAGPSAWARKDQLITTNKIREGIGMHLLMKMGWKPGEGLGRNNEGLVEPIMPMLKFDTKGLVSEEEKKKKSSKKYLDISEKNECNRHPVSILQEYCAKNKFSAPLYEMIQVTGPDHKRAFRMKVTVNGVEYLPMLTSCSKKQAKAVAAAVCLEAVQNIPNPFLAS